MGSCSQDENLEQTVIPIKFSLLEGYRNSKKWPQTTTLHAPQMGNFCNAILKALAFLLNGIINNSGCSWIVRLTFIHKRPCSQTLVPVS